MLYPISNPVSRLLNGELIAGYLAMKGIIKEIEKYKGDELLKKYPYLGPYPLFTVPLGEDLFNRIQNNNGNYIAFNKCSLYYENTNCHYSQGCRCYCGHCCRCCTCNHNNINDPNLPFGAIGDSLKKALSNFYNPFGNDNQINPGLFSINGNKGIYDCFFSDPNGYGYKFSINCEQIPFPKDVIPKDGNVSIFEMNDKKDWKKLKPFSNLFKTLSGYSLNFKNNTSKKRKNKDKDEEYIPTKEELNDIDNSEDNSLKENRKRKTKYIDEIEYKPTLEELQGLKNNNKNNLLKKQKKAKFIDEIEYKPTLEELQGLKSNNKNLLKNKRKRKNIDEEYRPSLDEINDAEKYKNVKIIFNQLKSITRKLAPLIENLGASRLEEQSKNIIITKQYFSKDYISIIKERDKSFYDQNKTDFDNFSFVINKYTGEDYKYLNEYLKTGKVIGNKFTEKELKSWAYCLHSSLVFRTSNVKNGTIVHRGIRYDPPKDWKVGKRFYFAEFISTSLDEKVAEYFSLGGLGKTILHIKIKNNGTNGHNNYCRYISDISIFKNEKEVLITAFCRYTITKIDGYEIYLDCEGY